jgi:hypothetical protein
VEVCEIQERLGVLTFSWCQPVTDDLDLRGAHSKVVRANNDTQEVRRDHAEGALFDFGVLVVYTKASQNLAYVFKVLFEIVRVDQNDI